MGKEDKLKKAFPEIKIKRDENKEKLEEVPTEVIAKALREMLEKEKGKEGI